MWKLRCRSVAGQGLIGGFFGRVFPELAMLPTSRHEAACASGSMAILGAMRDIEAGHYETACVVGLELMRNVSGKTGAEYLGAATWQGHEALSCDFPWPFMFDLITEEYDRRYGIRDDHLTQIAEINFANAKLNENAQTRAWQFAEGSFSGDETLNPVIEGRVRKLDCGQITDGAALSSSQANGLRGNMPKNEVLSCRTYRVSRVGAIAQRPFLWRQSLRVHVAMISFFLRSKDHVRCTKSRWLWRR